eukprot:15199069-Alexandrium_andersonii.AAC.1
MSLCVTRLLYNVAIWTPHDRKAVAKLNHCYVNLLRGVYHKRYKKGAPNLTDEQFLGATRAPRLWHILDSRGTA